MIDLPTSSAPSFPAWRIDMRRGLILAALCWLALVAIGFAVVSGRTQGFDVAGLMLWRDAATLVPIGPAKLSEFARDITSLGGVLLRNLFALGAAAALLFLHRRTEAFVLIATVSSGWLVNSGLKLLFARDRPDVVPHLMHADGFSFPSGHSFGSAVVFMAMALAFAALSSRKSVRVTLFAAALFIAAAVAWSRVWLGVHWPSDALAGWLGGIGWAVGAAALAQRTARPAYSA